MKCVLVFHSLPSFDVLCCMTAISVATYFFIWYKYQLQSVRWYATNKSIGYSGSLSSPFDIDASDGFVDLLVGDTEGEEDDVEDCEDRFSLDCCTSLLNGIDDADEEEEEEDDEGDWFSWVFLVAEAILLGEFSSMGGDVQSGERSLSIPAIISYN